MKYTREILEKAVAQSSSVTDVLRALGKTSLAGGSLTYMAKRLKALSIDTSHFRDPRSYLVPGVNKVDPVTRLKKRSSGLRLKHRDLKRGLTASGVRYACAECGLSEWRGSPLTLDVDHINGDWLDDCVENLRFLCPNCHRQTPTFGMRRRAPESEDV